MAVLPASQPASTASTASPEVSVLSVISATLWNQSSFYRPASCTEFSIMASVPLAVPSVGRTPSAGSAPAASCRGCAVGEATLVHGL